MLNHTYHTLNEIQIDQSALLSNYHYFSKINPQAQIAPVLKANAYGHGLNPIANFVDAKLSAPFICVDSLYEAYELSKQHIKTPILIMGYTDPRNYAISKKLPFSFAVFDTETLLALNKHQPGAKIHIKLDTGMCRLGLGDADLDSFIYTLKQCQRLSVEGIFSHLSQADEPSGQTFTTKQLRRFRQMSDRFETEGFHFKWRHIAATSGAVVTQDPYFNLVRLGLGFYGYSPFGPHTKEGRVLRKKLHPALTLYSHIAQIKDIEPGSAVGYGGTYTARQHERIATLPLGYNEGISRNLSNLGTVTIGKVICPIIGRVSMDMTTIKLTRNTIVEAKTPVVIFSPDPKATNSIDRVAQMLLTIPYTILVSLHPSIRRTMI